MTFHSPFRWCVVPYCNSSTLKTPEKLFIKVPNDNYMRNVWLEVSGRDPTQLSTKSLLHLCEDHFNLEQDMENYMQLKIMGSVSKIRMKPNTIPSKFSHTPIVSPSQAAHSTIPSKFSHTPLVSSSQAARGTSTSVHPGSSTARLEDENISLKEQKADKQVQVPVRHYKSIQTNLTPHYRSKATQIRVKVRHRMTSPIKSSTVSVATSPHNQITATNIPRRSGMTRRIKRKLSGLFEEKSDSELSMLSLTLSIVRSTSQDFSPTKVTTAEINLFEKPQETSKVEFSKYHINNKETTKTLHWNHKGTPLPDSGGTEQDALSQVVQQCRFCGEFSKDCAAVSLASSYLAGNKTALALNAARVQLDFGARALPRTVCHRCDAKLRDFCHFVSVVQAAQGTLINVAEENEEFETGAEYEETETVMVKTEYDSQQEDSDDDKEGILDSLFIGETVFIKETHKRKCDTDTAKRKKLKTKEKCDDDLAIDIKEEVIEKETDEQSEVSDTETDVKPSELELARSALVFKVAGDGTS